MFRISELCRKDIVNAADGRRLGFARDVELDLEQGRIRALILPDRERSFRWFGRGDEFSVEWTQIRRIGVDVVLVELPTASRAKAGRDGRRQDGEERLVFPDAPL